MTRSAIFPSGEVTSQFEQHTPSISQILECLEETTSLAHEPHFDIEDTLARNEGSLLHLPT